jgi:paraquat-inducible protein B
MYIDMKVGKSKKSLASLQARVDSVQQVLDGTMRSAAVDMDQSLGLVSMAPRVSTTKKQMETQMLGTLFAELTKNLELTKFTLGREEPVIQIVDAPTMPLLKEGKGRVKSAVIGGFLAGFLMLGFLFGKRFLDRL